MSLLNFLENQLKIKIGRKLSPEQIVTARPARYGLREFRRAEHWWPQDEIKRLEEGGFLRNTSSFATNFPGIAGAASTRLIYARDKLVVSTYDSEGLLVERVIDRGYEHNGFSAHAKTTYFHPPGRLIGSSQEPDLETN
jgi:hypothetical protein